MAEQNSLNLDDEKILNNMKRILGEFINLQRDKLKQQEISTILIGSSGYNGKLIRNLSIELLNKNNEYYHSTEVPDLNARNERTMEFIQGHLVKEKNKEELYYYLDSIANIS